MQSTNKRNISKWKTLLAAFILLCAAFASTLILYVLFETNLYIAAIASIVWVSVVGFFVLGSLAKKSEIIAKKLETSREDNKYRELLFDSIVKSVADGILYVSNAKIMMINDVAKEILKINDEDIETYDYDELVESFSKKLIYKELLDKISKGETKDIITREGLTYSLKFSAPMVSEKESSDKKIEDIIITLSDVTESYKMENMQVDFVANVSHELKTPLTTVKAYAETLLAGELEDPVITRDFLEIIVSEADRMDRLVKDLLLLNRMDNNQGKWKKAECDIISLVKTAMKKMDMTAKAKSIAVNRMFDEDLAITVEIDRDRMEQVILNILSNAIKYTDEKGRIDVDVFQEEKNVQIVISDNGIGIPEKAQPRVFERFFTVDKARTRDMGGTGLGLAISKQIVEDSDGTIGIESKFGKGTKVTISLPVLFNRGKSGIL